MNFREVNQAESKSRPTQWANSSVNKAHHLFYSNQSTISTPLSSILKFYFLWISFLLFLSNGITAQNFPVDLNLIVLPPQSPAYYTFAQSSSLQQSNKIQLNAILKDLLVEELDIGLEIEMLGPPGRFTSDPALLNIPFTLRKGLPTQISNVDLSGHFNSNGLSEVLVDNGGFLPEGEWQICATAYELLNREQVSQQTCYYMFLEDFDPPEIVFPEDSILPNFPQNVQVSWLPLHFGNFPLRYSYNIWEAIEGFQDNQIVESTFPIISKTLNQQTTDWVTALDPALIVGREYIIQVKVEDNVNGQMGPPVYAFKNNGLSEIKRFKYGMSVDGEECTSPANLGYTIDDSLRYFVHWDGGEAPLYDASKNTEGNNFGLQDLPNSSAKSNTLDQLGLPGGNNPGASITNNPAFYKMFYRSTDDGEEEWKRIETTEPWAPFQDFKRGRNYEVYVSKVCSAEERASETIPINLPILPPTRDFMCGMPALDIDLSNETPLQLLIEGDTIIAGDFRVVIEDVIGSNGRYSGSGYFNMGLFNTSVGVEFNNIFVNDEYRMTDGFIETMYDPLGSNIFNTNTATDLFNSPDEPFPVIQMAVFEGATFVDGQVVVYPGGGSYDSPLRVKTPEGDVLLTGGMILKEVDIDIPNQLSTNYSARFSPSSEQFYGFDKVDEKIKSEYESFDGKLLPHKSVSYGGFDYVKLKITIADGGWSASSWDSLRIVTESKFEIEFDKPVSNTKDIEIKLPGLEGEEKIFVLYNEECISVLNLAPYTLTEYTVNLVPVNGIGKDIDLTAVQQNVNKILSSGVVRIKMNLFSDQNFSYEDQDGEIAADTEILDAYSSDMQALLDKHLAEFGQEENELYIFLVDNLEGNVDGFMADGQTAGFVDIGASDLPRTITHELGHGAYTLKHFWEIYGSVYPQGSSDNLMDYGGDNVLLYKQWNRMHNQRFPTPWFKKGEEQMQIGEGKVACLSVEEVSKMNLGTTFYDGSLRAFDIPSTAIPRSFYRADNESDLQGILHSFIYENEVWSLHYFGGTKDFAGYAPVNNPNDKKFSDRKYGYENTDALGEKVVIDHISKTALLKQSNGNELPFTNISCDCPIGNGSGFGQSIVIDYTQTVDQEAIERAIADLNGSKDKTGVQVSVFIIDVGTSDSIRSSIQDQIDNITGDRYIVRLEFENDADYKPIEVYYGILTENSTFNEFLNEAIADAKLASKVSLDLLTDFLDGLAHITKNLAVPERFYNPEHSKYKPYLARLYKVSSYLNPTSYASTFILDQVENSGNYASYQIEFAFTVGVYNGLINQVGDLVELPSFLVKLITNEDGFKDKMLASFDQFKKDCEEAEQNWGGCAWDAIWAKIAKSHSGENSCLLAHQIGKDVSELATFILAFAKVGKLGKASALMEKLDASTYILKGGELLLKFSIAAGKTTFRFGKSTLFLVAEIGSTGIVTGWKIVKEIGGEVEQIINKGLDEFLPNPGLATVQIDDRLYLGVDNLSNWNVDELLSDAGGKIQDDFGNYLVELKKIGSDGLEESRLIIAKALELDEFYKFLKEDLSDDLLAALEEMPRAQKKVLNAGLKDGDTRIWIKNNALEGLKYWSALYKGGKTGGNNPASAVANKAGSLNAIQSIISKHPEMNIDIIAKIKGHSNASYEEVITDLNAMLTHSKTQGIDISYDNTSFDKLMTHWGNATNSQSKGVHGVVKAIQNPNYADLFNGKNLEFEEAVPNARPGEHNSNIDITTDGQPPLRIEVKNYNGNTSITNTTIKEQFIERDLFNAESLDEIIWIETGSNKISRADFGAFLKQSMTSLEGLYNSGKLQQLFPDERVTSVDDFINLTTQEDVFNSIFR